LRWAIWTLRLAAALTGAIEMIKARWAVRAGAAALALVVLSGCAHRPAQYGRVESGYGAYGGQAAPAGYDNPPVYSPRARDRYDRYGRGYGGQPEGYGYGRGTPAPQRGGYDRYGYGQQAGVEFGRVHHIEALSGYRGNSGGGALLGGIIGGLVGRQFGNSSTGRAQGTFAGAVGGVLIGNEIERQNRGGRDGLLVVIALEQGGTREFAVPSVGDLRVGDRVRIEGGNRLLRM
jgi:outer membrane lipoprotein SlyB